MKKITMTRKEEILSNFKEFSKRNNSPSICVNKFNSIKLNPFGASVQDCFRSKPIDTTHMDFTAIGDLNDLARSTSIMDDRVLMLEGQYPESCKNCWEVEKNGERISQRHIETVVKYSEIALTPLKAESRISHVEIALDNICTLRCIYCSPLYSSRIYQDVMRNGPIKGLGTNRDLDKLSELMSGREALKASIVDSVIKSLSELRTIMITGGEPLLDKQIWRLLDALSTHDGLEITTSITTNLNHDKKTISRLAEVVEKISSKGHKVNIVASCDTIGEEAEIIRDGLDYELFISNVETLLKVFKSSLYVRVMINSTSTALSLKSGVEWLMSLKPYFLTYSNFYLNMSIVSGVDALSPSILPESIRLNYINKIDELIKSNQAFNRIKNWEVIRNSLLNKGSKSRERDLLLLKRILIERSRRYQTKSDIFIKWIDRLLLGYKH